MAVYDVPPTAEYKTALLSVNRYDKRRFNVAYMLLGAQMHQLDKIINFLKVVNHSLR